MSVYLLATLDTKGREAAFVRDLLLAARRRRQARRCRLPGRAGRRGRHSARRSVRRGRNDAGRSSRCRRSRPGRHRRRSRSGAAHQRVAQQPGKVAGVLGLGGSAGTTIGTAAMRALPLGVPKLMVSTLASGQVRPYVGDKDILMLNSVVDIAGINRISRLVLGKPPRAMAGMVESHAPRLEALQALNPIRQAAHRRHDVRRHHALRRAGPPASSKRPATKCSSSTPPATAARRWNR